jgi:hypothetical protein
MLSSDWFRRELRLVRDWENLVTPPAD